MDPRKHRTRGLLVALGAQPHKLNIIHERRQLRVRLRCRTHCPEQIPIGNRSFRSCLAGEPSPLRQSAEQGHPVQHPTAVAPSLVRLHRRDEPVAERPHQLLQPIRGAGFDQTLQTSLGGSVLRPVLHARPARRGSARPPALQHGNRAGRVQPLRLHLKSRAVQAAGLG